MAGKTAEFEVTVSAVKRKVLPELNDELVKGLGEGLNTVADLRSRIRENLEARADEALRESLEEKVIDALVERTAFEVAPLHIEHEAEHILHDQQHALARYNISFEQYMRQTGRTGDQLVEEAKQSAEKRLKRTLVMDKLAEAESIEPSEDEVSQEIEQWKSQAREGDATDYDSEESRNAAVTILRRRKAMERALEIARSSPDGATKAKSSRKSRSKKASVAAGAAETGAETEQATEATEEKSEE
jgi:FKBP-type peptidyl-prolyl cis-trans isomerase (trigger factor)